MSERKKTIKNKPKTIEQITNENTIPYLEERGKPDFPKTNRGNDVSMRGEEFNDLTVGLEDINEAVMFYFKDIIKPYVIENAAKVNVPIFYANPERWKASQKDGMYRDKDGKIIFPVILVNRTSIDKVRTLGNKLDGNNVNNYMIYEKRYSSKNHYDNFSVVSNRIPVKEYVNVIIPDYYKISYACSIYVNFVADMDRIIEAIGQYSYSYWGREGKFKFMAMIDSFPTRTEIAQGEDRVVVCNFDITLNGYITPKDINKHLASSPKFLSKAQVIFKAEIQDSIETMNISMKQPRKQASFNIFPERVVVENQGSSSVPTEVLEYLSLNVSKKANVVTAPNIAVFNNVTIKIPPVGSGIPTPTVLDFRFFINGQFIPSNIVTLSENSGNLTAIFNNTLLQYLLEADDEIIIIGKLEVATGQFDSSFDESFE